ncbi:MAG: aminoglycoside phosphotransferase, partial [Actinomycetota bacterium]|nr:aminoglycoside phosphotransferase [Actinomycetota bacterium]
MTAALDVDGLAALLPGWLPEQRWFAGKGRPVAGCRVVWAQPLAEGDPALDDVLVRVDYADGGTDHYQLLVGRRPEPGERLEHAVVGPLGDEIAYDAVHDHELTGRLLELLDRGDAVGRVRFETTGARLDTSASSLVLGSEQSNTSVVYGDAYIYKLFRRIALGHNPDLEVTRALALAGSPHVPPPLAWAEGELDGSPVTLGLLQPFL